MRIWSVAKHRQKKIATNATSAAGQTHEGRPSLRDEERFDFCMSVRCAAATSGPAQLSGEYASVLRKSKW